MIKTYLFPDFVQIFIHLAQLIQVMAGEEGQYDHDLMTEHFLQQHQIAVELMLGLTNENGTFSSCFLFLSDILTSLPVIT